MNRLIKLVVALTLATSAFLVPGLVAGAATGAQAAPQQRAVATGSTSAAVAPRAAARTAVMKFKQTGRVTFKLWVKVTPAGGRKPAALQYSKKLDGKFRTIRKDKQNKKGVAKFGKVSKTGYYRVSVPKTKNYARTYSSNYVRIFKK